MIDEMAFNYWLLSAKTPTIRYLTQTKVLQFAKSDPLVKAAKDEIMTTGPVPEILKMQSVEGNWPNEHSYYTPKYTSTHWTLMLLTELEVDGRDPDFMRGVDFMLNDTATSVKNHLTANNFDLACLWGNLLRYAVHGGRLDDPRTQAIVTFLVRSVQNNGCQCEHNGALPCAWGVVRALWGLAGIPAGDRSPAVEQALQQGVEFLLDRFSLVEADYPVGEKSKIHPLWFRLNFPLFYQADILFTLRVLAELDALDHRGTAMALDWLELRRKGNGRWRGSSPFRLRTWDALGDRSETDRWVSLQAAAILQQAGRLQLAVPV